MLKKSQTPNGKPPKLAKKIEENLITDNHRLRMEI